MTLVEAALLLIAFLAVAVSTVTDLATRKIKDVVTYPAILLALAIHLWAGGWDGDLGLGTKWSLIGLLVGGLPFLAMNTIDSRAFGMGDVKLMAAVGALVGWPLVLEVLLYVALAGGAVAILVLARKGILRQALVGMLSGRGKTEGDAASPSSVYIPYGVAIAGGTVIVIGIEIYRKGILL